MEMKLGVDIGGVIIDRVIGKGRESFYSKNYLETLSVSGAFIALNILNKLIFQNNIYLISKCSTEIQKKTENWLDLKDFFQLTGISEDNVYYCKERYEKGPICKNLGITHFIDDRLENFGYLDGIKKGLLLNSRKEEIDKFNYLMNQGNIQVVTDWKDVVDIFCFNF